MLDRLAPAQQEALMELLIVMAKADGKVKDIEREILEQYADLVDVDFSSLTGEKTIEELTSLFDTAESRVIVLQELIRICHLDGLFVDDERSAIVDVAAMFGVPMSLLQELENWVVEGLRWSLRGEELLEEAAEVVRL